MTALQNQNTFFWQFAKLLQGIKKICHKSVEVDFIFKFQESEGSHLVQILTDVRSSIFNLFRLERVGVYCPTNKVIWRWDRGVMSHPKTGEAGNRSCDPWIGNLACYPLHYCCSYLD